MRNVNAASTSAIATVITTPASSPSHGDSANWVDSTAVLYAPTPTNAAWPNDVRPPTPVSSTNPSATIAYSPIRLSCVIQNSGTGSSGSASSSTAKATNSNWRGDFIAHSSSLRGSRSERHNRIGRIDVKTITSLNALAQNEPNASSTPTP